MAQTTQPQDQSDDTRTRGAAQQPADQGRERNRKTDETQQMETAASRIGGTARSESQAGADTLRELGQTTRTEVEKAGRATERNVQSAGSHMRSGAEQLGERSQQLAETGADQFERMGEMMAEAARDAADSARMMMSFGSFITGGLKDMQEATSGAVERLFQTNMDMMQRMMHQANAAEIASSQQRIMRQYLEAMTQSSAEMLRAVQRSADNVLHSMNAGNGGSERGDQHQRTGTQRQEQEQQQQQTIAELMHRGLRTTTPDTSARDAAALMAEENIGVIPVVEGDRLVGVITDRDIAIRAAGQGKDPDQTKVRELMSADIVSCHEDDPVDEVIDRMASQQLHRLPVLDGDDKPIGIVTLADLVSWNPARGGEALRGISRQSRQHAQGLNG